MSRNRYSIKTVENLENWIELLQFAKTNNYLRFQKALVHHMITYIFKKVATGVMDYDKVVDHLIYLISQLQNTVNVGIVGREVENATHETVLDLAKLYNVLLKEIIGKRRNTYAKFFDYFISTLVEYLSYKVVQDESVTVWLDILMSSHKWRFVIPGAEWKYKIKLIDMFILCLVDPTIRESFCDKQFVPDVRFLRALESCFERNFSLNFKKACERYLWSSDELYSNEELIELAREHYPEVAEKISRRPV
ncbi:hypothetical protein MP638_005207 [Amoeboaphelidium occidentale]|nr:hypothetical protein MP638_005207 [Amoeboaphelidium occidentale]